MAAIRAIDAGSVLALITLLVLPIAAVAFARSGGAWGRVGKGAFAIEREPPPEPGSRPSRLDRRLQEAEARQMLEAKAYRHARSGAAPVDVESELAELMRPSGVEVDDELRDEVRRLVVSRNERRMRRGEEPLDVESEIERQLADLVGSS